MSYLTTLSQFVTSLITIGPVVMLAGEVGVEKEYTLTWHAMIGWLDHAIA